MGYTLSPAQQDRLLVCAEDTAPAKLIRRPLQLFSQVLRALDRHSEAYR